MMSIKRRKIDYRCCHHTRAVPVHSCTHLRESLRKYVVLNVTYIYIYIRIYIYVYALSTIALQQLVI